MSDAGVHRRTSPATDIGALSADLEWEAAGMVQAHVDSKLIRRFFQYLGVFFFLALDLELLELGQILGHWIVRSEFAFFD